MTRIHRLPIVALLLAAACSSDRPSTPPAEEKSAPPSAPTQASSPGAGPGSEVEGTWRVAGRQAPGVSAMTEGESEAMVGRTAEYTASVARVGSDACQLPVYRRETVAAGEFQKAFRVPPAAVGLPDPVTLVRVHCGGAEWSSPGALLMVAGPGRLLTVWDGVFFRLERA
ncbi:MAG TPA: hypothetical protein VHG91_01735 [Longimicrobium sp.]|nr:hypothetical protein [Longimicrobium sp.]